MKRKLIVTLALSGILALQIGVSTVNAQISFNEPYLLLAAKDAKAEEVDEELEEEEEIDPELAVNRDLVRESEFGFAPGKTIGSYLDKFFKDSKWEGIVSEDEGFYYVNFTGECQYKKEDVTILLQFAIYEDQTSELVAMEMNEEPQDEDIMDSLLKTVFGVK